MGILYNVEEYWYVAYNVIRRITALSEMGHLMVMQENFRGARADPPPVNLELNITYFPVELINYDSNLKLIVFSPWLCYPFTKLIFQRGLTLVHIISKTVLMNKF